MGIFPEAGGARAQRGGDSRLALLEAVELTQELLESLATSSASLQCGHIRLGVGGGPLLPRCTEQLTDDGVVAGDIGDGLIDLGLRGLARRHRLQKRDHLGPHDWPPA
jgi:hypothetical protein